MSTLSIKNKKNVLAEISKELYSALAADEHWLAELDKHLVDLASIEDQANQEIDIINAYRASLKYFLSTEKLGSHSNEENKYDVIYGCLLILARYWPLNNTDQGLPICPVSLETLSNDKPLLTTEGYWYDPASTRGILKSSRCHPLNRQPIGIRDQIAMGDKRLLPYLFNFKKTDYSDQGRDIGGCISLFVLLPALFTTMVVSAIVPWLMLPFLISAPILLGLALLIPAIGEVVGNYCNEQHLKKVALDSGHLFTAEQLVNRIDVEVTNNSKMELAIFPSAEAEASVRPSEAKMASYAQDVESLVYLPSLTNGQESRLVYVNSFWPVKKEEGVASQDLNNEADSSSCYRFGS